jgi:hypothetical protein
LTAARVRSEGRDGAIAVARMGRDGTIAGLMALTMAPSQARSWDNTYAIAAELVPDRR